MSPKLTALLLRSRSEAGLTQADLAAALDVTRPTITRIESGERDTTVERLERWAEACGWTVTLGRRDPIDLVGPLNELSGLRLHVAERLLRMLPRLDEAHIISLVGLLDAWERVKSSADEQGRPLRKSG